MPHLVKARENPLATNKLESLPFRFTDCDRDYFYNKLKKMHYRGALVGAEGSGKTSLLLEIARNLHQFEPVLIRLSGGKRNLPLSFWLSPLNSKNIVFVDSAENLPFYLFFLLKLKCHFASGLIVTAHKEGLLPTLINCRTSVELLDELIETLLGYKLAPERVEALYKRSGGNIRLAFMHLYSDI